MPCLPHAAHTLFLTLPHLQDPPATSGSPSEPSSMSKLGQNFNAAGVGLFFRLLGGNQALAMPHLSVPDIRSIDWAALSAAGFKGVVFDKDNTLTAPFSLEVEPRLRASLAAAGAAFGGRLVLYSNSAGLQQYDPHGEEAVRLEAALGIPVLRHKDKKPAGGAAELEAHFGCLVSELVMVGDRYLTDVVFGNRHGMLTVRPVPLTRAGEPAGVVLARGVEEHFVGRWGHKGVTAPPHPLLTRAGAPLLSSFLISVPPDLPGQSQ